MMAASPELIQSLIEALKPSIEAAVAQAVRAVVPTPTPAAGTTVTRTSSLVDPVSIPRPPTTAASNKPTATCKPPKEPALTGDKAHEWMEFEREFLRYFRITQSYYHEPEVQVDLLLALAGEKVRKIFYQLNLPAEHAKDLERVITALRQVFAQHQSPFVNSYLFMKIRRDPGEDLDDFVSRLREAAVKCAFADEDRRVLEQLVFSTIDNVDVLKRIIKESPPTLDEMIRILKTDEAAKQEMDRMVGKEVSVNEISNRRPHNGHRSQRNSEAVPRSSDKKSGSRLKLGGDCRNCIFDHTKDTPCPAKNMECFYCRNTGHMIAKCRKRQAQNGTKGPTQNQKKVNEIEQVSDAESSDDEEPVIDSVFIGSTGKGEQDKSWQTAIRISNKKVNCKIDTGAEVNVMPHRVFKQLSDKPRLSPTRTVLHTVAGQVKPLGVIQVPVQHKNHKVTAKFYVVEDRTSTLCGLQTSVELGLVQKLFM